MSILKALRMSGQPQPERVLGGSPGSLVAGACLTLAFVVITCNGPAFAATPLAEIRFVPDTTILAGGAVVGPADVARDDLNGSPAVLVGPGILPAGTTINAYHFNAAPGTHWFVLGNTASLPGGVVAGPRDIVAYNGSQYSLLYSAAALGLPDGVAIDALATLDGTALLLSFDTSVTLPGAGVIQPSDVVLYNSGVYSMLMSAEAAGVPPGVNLVGLDHLANGHLLVSFDVSGAVGGVAFARNDILEYTPGSPGTWEPVYRPAVSNPGWNSAGMRDFSVRTVAAQTMVAVEFHHAQFDHYFVTVNADEISKLDVGFFVGWARTGETFKVYPTGTTGAVDVCRFFSTTFAKSSHFYTPFASECATVKQSADWQYEGLVFAVGLPDSAGNCPGGTQPLYRLYNDGQGAAPNHRYTTSLATRSTMIAQKWIPEGSGTIGVIACVPL